MADIYEITFRLILATLIGGIIGLEREVEDKPAGFRTHILVCVGSALVMLISLFMYYDIAKPDKLMADPGRIAAQVVVGIGFLGAGTIIRYGTSVRGLTTAASLWTISAIGLAIGCGFYSAAIASSVILFTVLFVFERTEKYLKKKRLYRTLRIETLDMPGKLGQVGCLLGELKVNIRNMEIKRPPDKIDIAILEIIIDIPPEITKEKIVQEISQLKDVRQVQVL